MSFEVRPAGETDVPALAALEREARGALVEVRGGPQLLAEAPAVGDWSAVVGGVDRLTLVAVIDDVVVGYLVASLPASGGTGVIEQVYVMPEARCVGFGDTMLETAIQAMRDAGAESLESFALPGDRETKNLFERAGVTARKIVVSKRLR